MTSGYTNNPKLLLDLLQETRMVKGALVEAGVWEADKYLHFLTIAEQFDKKCYAIDSFKGLSKPGKYDNEKIYPTGRFNVGGADWLRAITMHRKHARICEGFITAKFLKATRIRKISFIHVDLDIYTPTKIVFEWAWPRLTFDGIMVCHDYKKGNMKNCSRAVEEWMQKHGVKEEGVKNTWIWFKKGL